MVATKWFQEGDIVEILDIRNSVFKEELGYEDNLISDDYDIFAKKLLVFEDEVPVGTARLIFRQGRYEIDKICVLPDYRRKKYADLMIRMLVRKAVELGAENTIAYIEPKYEQLFLRIGFTRVEETEHGYFLMNKAGDIISHC